MTATKPAFAKPGDDAWPPCDDPMEDTIGNDGSDTAMRIAKGDSLRSTPDEMDTTLWLMRTQTIIAELDCKRCFAPITTKRGMQF